MADVKISQLPNAPVVAADDLFVIVDQAPVCQTSNLTFGDLERSLTISSSLLNLSSSITGLSGSLSGRINLLETTIPGYLTTASFNSWTGSIYNINSASWNLKDTQLELSASIVSTSLGVLYANVNQLDLDYQIDSASWNGKLDALFLAATASAQCCATNSLSIAALNAHSQSINNWSSSVLLESEFDAWRLSPSASFAGTASYASKINVTSSNIAISWVGDQLQLTSQQLEVQSLQAVTTVGNTTSQSIVVTGPGNIVAPSFTGSLLGTASHAINSNNALTASYFLTSSVTSASLAQTASHIDLVGQYIQVNKVGSQFQITGSDPASFVTTASFGAFTSSYAIDSASWNASVASLNISASNISQSVAILSASHLDISASISQRALILEMSASRYEIASASVSAINIWSSSVLLESEFDAWRLSPSASFAGTASYASKINVTGSNVGVNWVGDQLQLSVTPTDLSGYQTTASFIAWTQSPSASMAGTASNANLLEGKNSATFLTTGSGGANQLVNGGFTFVGGATISGSNFSGTSSWANNSTQAISASLASLALTASYIKVSTLGITNKWSGDVLELTSSLRSVNGIFPDAVTGNVAVALSETYTGTSASFAAIGANTASYAEASIWVISGDPNPSQNGKTYIYNSGSVGQWFEVAPFDQASNDARYLKLDASNDPMQGELSMGGFKITSLLDGVLSTDAVNLGQLTASINTAISYYTPTSSFNAFTGSYNSGSFSGSFVGELIGTASHANNSDNALTASYINVEGLDIVTKWFGSKLELTGSNVDGFLTTSSFNSWTGSKFEPLSQSVLDARLSIVNLGISQSAIYASQSAASASVQAINAVTSSYLTHAGYALSSSIFISTGSAASVQQIDGSLIVNKLTGSLLGTATTASYVNIKGDSNTGITVNYNGSEIQISGSLTDLSGYKTTASFDAWTGSAASNFNGTSATASYFLTSSVTSASLAQDALTASFVTGSSVWGPYGSNSVISASHAVTASYSINANSSSYAATASYTVNQIFLTGSSALSVLAKDANGYGQDGRVSIIGDGASGSVTITTDINSEPNFCAAYLKYGGGNIVFAAGAGTTIFQTDNTLALSGKAGSSATLNRIGNEFYLRINNAS